MNSSNKLATLFLTLLLSFTPVFAQQPAAATSKPLTLTELRERIAAMIDQPKFASARWGIRIITMDGRAVFEREADKAFMPASNMKLYTSSVALDSFGPDYKIKTSVYATKPVKGGVLRGDLILYGRGDPNLSPRFDTADPKRYSEFTAADKITAIEQLADQIKARGIRVISGNLIGDDSFFAGDLLGPGWEWDDTQFYYGAEVSALTVNDNCVTFTVTSSSKIGGKPIIKIQPQTGYLKIINNATTSSKGPTRIGVNRQLNSNTVEFFGTIPRNAKEFEVDIAVHDPTGFAATLLKESLERRKIRIRGRVRRMDAIRRLTQPLDKAKLIEVAAIESQPISEMIKVINKQSQNLHTELMLRQLGAKHSEFGTLDDYGRPKPTARFGNELCKEFLQRAGVETQYLSLRDGSGLARQNLVTPRSTSELLKFMVTNRYFEAFRESLGIAGVDGTLERRMRGSAAMNNFRGKTGTLSYVNSLSGYLTTRRGQMLIVSAMGNNYVGAGRDVSGVLDQICVMLAECETEL
jgi:D-alanyl-D-alanine carboxypeptidase/D-alanyl-D-alanine-endopeptidase (penicillin-binding protein 4)